MQKAEHNPPSPPSKPAAPAPGHAAFFFGFTGYRSLSSHGENPAVFEEIWQGSVDGRK